MEPNVTGYTEVIVTKPWGHEYLMYQNAHVGIWYLFIKYGAHTSLHCHPKKKTGLVVLSGEAEVRFMNESMKLAAMGRLIIRPGLFHSTSALSPEGVAMIEVETPPIKTNLVRFKDVYGREEASYESDEAMLPIHDGCLRLQVPEQGAGETYRLHGCTVIPERIDDMTTLRDRSPNELILVLEGGLMSCTDEHILGAGDVVTIGTVNRLAEAFAAPDGMAFLRLLRTACDQDQGKS